MESMESRMNPTSEGVEGQVSADSVAFGDVIYVRLHGDSWWPAQVVDGEKVTGNVKPVKRCTGDVLVRLYGSYTFLYVDPIESCSEFKMVLRNNNWDLKKILEEALVEDLPSTKKSSKAKGTPSKKSASKRKSSGQDERQNKALKDGASGSRETASGKPQELSSRRIRVMESLGLIAPAGSPFRKHAHNYNKTS